MVQEALVRAQAASARVALLQTTLLPQAEQTLEVARAAYQTDRVDFLALMDDSRVRLAVRLEYYEALAALEQARVDLERAVGVDLERSARVDPPAHVEPPALQAGGPK
jgi:outer membrane protein TolC